MMGMDGSLRSVESWLRGGRKPGTRQRWIAVAAKRHHVSYWPLPTKSILLSLHPSFGLHGGFQSFTA